MRPEANALVHRIAVKYAIPMRAAANMARQHTIETLTLLAQDPKVEPWSSACVGLHDISQASETPANPVACEADAMVPSKHTLPDPWEIPAADFIKKSSKLWFADCTAQQFQWYADNEAEFLLETLLWRNRLVQQFFEIPGFRLVDLLEMRGREDLKSIVREKFPFIAFC
ncbi:MAG: hypothetical protein SGCHY_003215 [Lobulomycetales sp.]